MPKVWTLYIIFFFFTFKLSSQVVPSFTSDTQNGCSPLVVNFINTSQNATNYVWDFGNGIQSTLTNPSTTYTSPGFYTVKLIAQNATDTDSIIQQNYIQVLDLPTAIIFCNHLSQIVLVTIHLILTTLALVLLATHGTLMMGILQRILIHLINII